MTTSELSETTGRWLGERGIFRHFQPTDDEALEAASESGEPVLHVMSTCLSGSFDGDMTGELVRWAEPDGTIRYEATVGGLPERGDTNVLVAAGLGELCDVAKVLGNLGVPTSCALCRPGYLQVVTERCAASYRANSHPINHNERTSRRSCNGHCFPGRAPMAWNGRWTSVSRTCQWAVPRCRP